MNTCNMGGTLTLDEHLQHMTRGILLQYKYCAIESVCTYLSSFSELVSMLGILSKYIKEVSVLRKLLFAISFLPEDLPNRWDIAIHFAYSSQAATGITPQHAKTLSENIQLLDAHAFSSDELLRRELMTFPKGKPLGIILLSARNTCIMCSSNLLVRKDRPSSVVVYDDHMGSVLGTHYHKYCSNRACGCTQFYGYHAVQGVNLFDPNWESLTYFVSSRETAFSMHLMKRFTSQILLGQMSFKQCADVYNHLHQPMMNESEIQL